MVVPNKKRAHLAKPVCAPPTSVSPPGNTNPCEHKWRLRPAERNPRGQRWRIWVDSGQSWNLSVSYTDPMEFLLVAWRVVMPGAFVTNPTGSNDASIWVLPKRVVLVYAGNRTRSLPKAHPGVRSGPCHLFFSLLYWFSGFLVALAVGAQVGKKGR
eukprot:3935842-Rhodomonas_salina.3